MANIKYLQKMIDRFLGDEKREILLEHKVLLSKNYDLPVLAHTDEKRRKWAGPVVADLSYPHRDCQDINQLIP